MSEKNLFRFQNEWLRLNDFKSWLIKINDNGKAAAFCKLCNKKLKCHKPVLSRHMLTNSHQTAASAIKSTTNISKALQNSTSKNGSVKRAELKMVGTLTTNHLAFRLVDDLIPVLKSCLPDSDILKDVNLHRTKATALVKNVLGPSFSEELYNKLQKPVFSIIIDETTDVSTTKQIAFTTIYYNDETSRIH